MTICRWCHKSIALFDKAPQYVADENRQAWATDHCGDIDHDFICDGRETTAMWPEGKPHEPVARQP